MRKRETAGGGTARYVPGQDSNSGAGSTVMESNTVPADAVVDAMADQRRRTVLQTLTENGQSATSMTTLTDAVAERATSEALSDDEHRQRILLALHHRHLPKLADAGLVRYDSEGGRIRSTLGDSEQDLLETVDAHSRRE